MKKILVAYFSATQSTKKLATTLASVTDADIYEIKPEIPYTKKDLNWMDTNSRSSIEMKNKTYRPSIIGKVDTMDTYDTIFIGFPIWWYVAPTIINTFLEQYNLNGKTIIPFATSGGSGMGNTNKELKDSCKGAILLEGKVFKSNTREEALKKWIEQNKIGA
ncbi:MAG: NAD(P)H-dependent oxidoreductase [Holdemanella sp.]|nr:NAD(P)H-dependent oxidoreductase [Holdemanella sp.]